MLKNDYSQVREYELKDTQVLVVDLTKKQLDDMRDEEGKTLPISEEVRFFVRGHKFGVLSPINKCQIRLIFL